MPNQELFLVDAEGREVGATEVGELVVRGAHVMRGYWEMPDETARKLRPLHQSVCERTGVTADERELYTGDLFRRDDEGYFTFVARTDDIIKSRGEKVSPHEVERALLALDGVREAAVVGVPHPLLGSAIKAIVVLAAGAQLTAQQVRQHCARALEEHRVPHVVEIRAELPKDDRGKVARAAL
jgi:acyl-coenzyme A synthetase/AMP-(fatty) acid ligase